MKPLPYFAVASQQVAKHAVMVLKLEATYTNATTGLFLQIHDGNSTPAAGAVPKKSWPVEECGYKEFKVGELDLFLGCFVGLSSTAATYTASAVTLDVLQIELSDPERLAGLTTLVGDLTTPVTGLQVWTEAAGVTRKALVALEVDGTNLTGVPGQFIQVFATDTVNTGDAPLVSIPIATGQVLTLTNGLHFGDQGREVFSIDSASPFTKRLGCTVKISSTGSTYTACNGTVAIRAEYKNQ
jgi:hypothetical protein